MSSAWNDGFSSVVEGIMIRPFALAHELIFAEHWLPVDFATGKFESRVNSDTGCQKINFKKQILKPHLPPII